MPALQTADACSLMLGSLLLAVQVQLLLQQLKQQQLAPGPTGTQAAVHQPTQPPSPTQQPLPWSELNKLRSQLDLQRLPQQLVVGSK